MIRRVSLFLALAAIATAAGLHAATAAEQAGVSAAVVGAVELKPEAAPARTATPGMDVFLGDEVTSQRQSRMQILLLDETVFTVGPQSNLVIDEFVYDPDANVGQLTASFSKGLFRYVSGKLAKAQPENVRIRVPNAIIGIRGTAMFGVEDEQSGGIFYGLLGPGPQNNAGLGDGGMTYQSADGKITREVVRAGFGVLATDGTVSPVIRTPARLLQSMQRQLTAGAAAAAQRADTATGDSASDTSGQSAAETAGTANQTDLEAQAAVMVTGASAEAAQTTNDQTVEAANSATTAAAQAVNEASGRLPFGVAIPHAVEMAWSNIADLDLHLTGPISGSSSRFHVFFSNPGDYSASPFAVLDLDRTGVGGGEAIGLSQLTSGGLYKASVFNFGDSATNSTSLSNQANLTVRFITNGFISRGSNGSAIVGGTEVANVSPATGQQGNTYQAFQFDSNGTVTILNQFTNFASSSAVQ